MQWPIFLNTRNPICTQYGRNLFPRKHGLHFLNFNQIESNMLIFCQLPCFNVLSQEQYIEAWQAPMLTETPALSEVMRINGQSEVNLNSTW
jgi:hypothetical protein